MIFLIKLGCIRLAAPQKIEKKESWSRECRPIVTPLSYRSAFADGQHRVQCQPMLPQRFTMAIALLTRVLSEREDQWVDFEAARKVMIPNFSQVHAAARYRQVAA